MSDDVYFLLRDRLHSMPGGYPEAHDGLEIRLLKKLYTPEEAGIFLNLKMEPEDVSVIAARCGMDESCLAAKLEDMAVRGLAFRVRAGGKADGSKLYQAFQFFWGIADCQVNRVDRELADLLLEYFPYLGTTGLALETKQVRVLPVERSIKSQAAVETYNRLRDMVGEDELIAVAPCMCRQMAGVRGKECGHPHETCLSFGMHAQYFLDNGAARRISREELLSLLDDAEQWGLVINTSNSRDLSVICLCCRCCCAMLNNLKLLPECGMAVNSWYRSAIDRDACTACGLCLERCPVDAIREDGDTMEALPERCIGCGLCASACPADAVSMIEKPGAKPPLDDVPSLMKQVAKERGLI